MSQNPQDEERLARRAGQEIAAWPVAGWFLGTPGCCCSSPFVTTREDALRVARGLLESAQRDAGRWSHHQVTNVVLRRPYECAACKRTLPGAWVPTTELVLPRANPQDEERLARRTGEVPDVRQALVQAWRDGERVAVTFRPTCRTPGQKGWRRDMDQWHGWIRNMGFPFHRAGNRAMHEEYLRAHRLHGGIDAWRRAVAADPMIAFDLNAYVHAREAGRVADMGGLVVPGGLTLLGGTSHAAVLVLCPRQDSVPERTGFPILLADVEWVGPSPPPRRPRPRRHANPQDEERLAGRRAPTTEQDDRDAETIRRGGEVRFRVRGDHPKIPWFEAVIAPYKDASESFGYPWELNVRFDDAATGHRTHSGYHASTLAEHDPGRGLALWGDVPEWVVSGEGMDEVVRRIRALHARGLGLEPRPEDPAKPSRRRRRTNPQDEERLARRGQPQDVAPELVPHGYWTPQGMVLCASCVRPERVLHETPQPRGPGEDVTRCDACQAWIQVQSKVAHEHELLREIRAMNLHGLSTARMEQTGGMCSAVGLKFVDGEYLLLVEDDSRDGVWHIGPYGDDDAWGADRASARAPSLPEEASFSVSNGSREQVLAVVRRASALALSRRQARRDGPRRNPQDEERLARRDARHEGPLKLDAHVGQRRGDPLPASLTGLEVDVVRLTRDREDQLKLEAVAGGVEVLRGVLVESGVDVFSPTTGSDALDAAVVVSGRIVATVHDQRGVALRQDRLQRVSFVSFREVRLDDVAHDFVDEWAPGTTLVLRAAHGANPQDEERLARRTATVTPTEFLVELDDGDGAIRNVKVDDVRLERLRDGTLSIAGYLADRLVLEGMADQDGPLVVDAADGPRRLWTMTMLGRQARPRPTGTLSPSAPGPGHATALHCQVSHPTSRFVVVHDVSWVEVGQQDRVFAVPSPTGEGAGGDMVDLYETGSVLRVVPGTVVMTRPTSKKKRNPQDEERLAHRAGTPATVLCRICEAPVPPGHEQEATCAECQMEASLEGAVQDAQDAVDRARADHSEALRHGPATHELRRLRRAVAAAQAASAELARFARRTGRR